MKSRDKDTLLTADQLKEVTLVFYLIQFTLVGPWKCTGTYISLQIPANLLPRAFFIIKALVH